MLIEQKKRKKSNLKKKQTKSALDWVFFVTG